MLTASRPSLNPNLVMFFCLICKLGMLLDEGDGPNGNRYDVSVMRHMAPAHTNELALLSTFASL